jgi:hypothetical protein
MRVFVAAVMLASFAFAFKMFVLVPPHAEAGKGTINAASINAVSSAMPCPDSAARWCHEFGGLAE